MKYNYKLVEHLFETIVQFSNKALTEDVNPETKLDFDLTDPNILNSFNIDQDTISLVDTALTIAKTKNNINLFTDYVLNSCNNFSEKLCSVKLLKALIVLEYLKNVQEYLKIFVPEVLKYFKAQDLKVILAHISENLPANFFDEINSIQNKIDAESLELPLEEAKRYVRRYYIRPQDIFCSNKDELLKALIDIGSENCSIYTLVNLGDDKDVNKLTKNDIIYYYDNEILYDKNHVKVMDYNLYIKNEEDRKKFPGDEDSVSDAVFKDTYDDRMTDQTITEAKQKQPEKVCCICGEPIKGYGNNPYPYMEEGECCDSCNVKFVIPARLDKLMNQEEEED